MYKEKPVSQRFPKVPFQRRAAAFFIDFFTVWIASSLGGKGYAQCFIFLIFWMALRVFAVEANKGQSLGHWAMDLKVIDTRSNKLPELLQLAKRESIVGFAALLAAIGLSINLTNSVSMLLLIVPLLADAAAALTDEKLNQAFHDRLAETIVIQTRRGFSLDLRLQKIIDKVVENMRR